MPPNSERAAASVQSFLDELAALLAKRLASLKAKGRRLRGSPGIAWELRCPGERTVTVIVEPRGISTTAAAVSTRWLQAYARAPRAGFSPGQRTALGSLFPEMKRVLAGLERRLSDESWEAWLRQAAARRQAPELIADVLHSYPFDALPLPGEAAGKTHILRVTFACNQACAFCFVDLSSKQMIPLDKLESVLDSIPRARRAVDELSISGGEPTAHPRLPEITAMARAKGFRRLVLQTNAVLLSRPGLAERLGPMNYYVSFHSHEPEVYDRLTASRALFASAVEGLGRILSAPGNGLTLNILVTSLNFARLPEHVAFIDRLRGGRAVAVFFTMLNNTGVERIPEFAADLAVVRPYLARAAADCLARGMRVVNFEGNGLIPACLFEAPEAFAPRDKRDQGKVRYRDDFSGCNARITAKSPSCKSCAFDRSCLGVPVSYAQRFGLSALTPIAKV